MIADASNHRDQPAVAANHVLAIVSQEGQTDIDRPAVVVTEIAADDREHWVLPGRLDVVGDRVRIHAAIAAGDEVDCVGRLGRHCAEAVGGRTLADAELIIGPRLETRELSPKDFEVGHRVRLGRGRLRLDGCQRKECEVLRRLIVDLGIRRRPGGANPLHGHRCRGVALPGEEQRTRLEGGVVQWLGGDHGRIGTHESWGTQARQRGPEERTTRG